jgi:hypothetical protein
MKSSSSQISMSRTDGFRSLPIKQFENLDNKLIETMKYEQLINEDEVASKNRMLEVQFGPENLRNVFNPKFTKSREGKSFQIVQKLDGKHIDRPSDDEDYYPLNPDMVEKEMDYVGFLKQAMGNADRMKNKYLTSEQVRRKPFTK